MATAILACGGGEEERNKVYQSVYIDHEERFIDQNIDALEGLRTIIASEQDAQS